MAGNLPTAVELTRRLIRFNTINPPGAEEAAAHHLGELLAAGGFAVSYHEFAPQRTSLIARRAGSDETRAPLCFTGHLDTVPLGAAPWSVDPFAGEIADGKLFGRGASDTKSGVAAFVAAALQAGKEAARGPGLVLAITAGEETGCQGAFHLAQSAAGLLGPAGLLMVAEPTSNYPFLGHKGALWLRALSRGVTAHSSMPERGVNAVYKMARILAKLESWRFPEAPHPVMGRSTLNVGTVAGGMNINSVPDRAELTIDIRTIAGSDHARLRALLTAQLAPELDELETVLDLGSVWTDPGRGASSEIFAALDPLLKERLEPRAAPYFTDAAALHLALGGVPTVILGPGEPDLAHQTDEFCRVAKIEQAVELYRALIRRAGALQG